MELNKPCTVWTGTERPNGYGQLTRNRKQYMPHRVAYAEANGLDVDTMGGVVMHSCDNRMCIEPSHLSLGTQQDNMDDKVAKGRQAKGSGHGMAKLTSEKVESIRARYQKPQKGNRYGNGRAICAEFDITPSMLSHIILRHNWV